MFSARPIKGESLMVKPEVIRKRFNKLDEYLNILKKLQRYTRSEFLSDPEHYGSTERFLHLSIELLTDVGNHIIAEEELGMVNWYSDIPDILNSKNIINIELKEIWIKMIGFRNTLIHEYIDIDLEIVYDVLQNGLDDLESIKLKLAVYL
jgi:uncharacterized protein YutE (UPF0331/DUF86 family)